MHLRADIDSREVDMGSCERAVMGLELRAVSARVTKHFVIIFSLTCNNTKYICGIRVNVFCLTTWIEFRRFPCLTLQIDYGNKVKQVL